MHFRHAANNKTIFADMALLGACLKWYIIK